MSWPIRCWVSTWLLSRHQKREWKWKRWATAETEGRKRSLPSLSFLAFFVFYLILSPVINFCHINISFVVVLCSVLIVASPWCLLLGCTSWCYGSLHKLNRTHCEFKVSGKQLFLCATNKQEYYFLCSHAACRTPENRRFPGDEAVSVCGLFVCPAAFVFVSPHLCFCFPCKVYVESNEHHTSFLLTAATENSTSSELTRCLRQKAKADKRHKHMAKTWIRSEWEEKWKPIGHLQSLSYQENLTQHRNLTWQRAA